MNSPRRIRTGPGALRQVLFISLQAGGISRCVIRLLIRGGQW